jgi:hypothetical protein
MSRWLQRTPISADGNGTTSQHLAFGEPADGSTLVLIAASTAIMDLGTLDWDVMEHSLSGQDLYVWTKVADGTEDGVDIVVSVADAPVQALLLEFPQTTDSIATAHQSDVPRSGVPVTGLTGLPSSEKLLIHIASYGSNNPTAGVSSVAWGDATVTDSFLGADGGGSVPGISLLVGYLEDSVLTSWAPTVLLGDPSPFGSTTERITLALQVPTTLDNPVVTVVSTTAPTVPGAEDGEIEISWPDVTDADHYTVGIADGYDQTTGFTVTDPATSPHTFTGLAAGHYTVAAKAIASA